MATNNAASATSTTRARRYYQRGLHFYTRGKWSDAVDNLREAIKLFPEHASARMHLGAALSRQRLYLEAVHVLEEGRQLANLDDDSRLTLLKLIATVCVMRQDFPAAEFYLRDALRLAPNDPKLGNRLASVLCKAERFEEGFDRYLDVARATPRGD